MGAEEDRRSRISTEIRKIRSTTNEQLCSARILTLPNGDPNLYDLPLKNY